MKITSFWVFIIFIGLLVAILLVNHYFRAMQEPQQENFISFVKDTPLLNSVVIPTYSSKATSVVKLYDNLFFDTQNANLIEVNGSSVYVPATTSYSAPETTTAAPATTTAAPETTAATTTTAAAPETTAAATTTTATPAPTATEGFTDAQSTDNTGLTISSILVKQRNGVLSNKYSTTLSPDQTSVVNTPAPESTISSIPSSFSQWIYSTITTNTDKYQVIYIAWDKDTYIHIINLPANSNVGAFLFNGSQIQKSLSFDNYTKLNISNSATFIPDADDGQMITQALYNNRSVFKICYFLNFDPANGNLILVSGTPAQIQVFDRFKNPAFCANMGTTIPSGANSPWMINDPTGTYAVFYIPIEEKTLIYVLQMINYQYSVISVCRFDRSGIVYPTYPTPAPTSAAPMSGGSAGAGTGDARGIFMMSFFNTIYNSDLTPDQAKAWGENLGNIAVGGNGVPIAPANPNASCCPLCANNAGGVCPNCGGNGGCGTMDRASGASVVGTQGGAAATTSFGGPVYNPNSLGGVINNTEENIVDLAKSTGSGASGLLKATGSGATDLLKSTGSGATGLLTATGSGATDLLKSAGSGLTGVVMDTQGNIIDLAKSTGSGVSDLLKSTGSGIANLGAAGGGMSMANGAAASGGLSTGPGEFSVGTTTSGTPLYPPGKGIVPGVDIYSQYGLSASKGSDFMPMNASFSAFS